MGEKRNAYRILVGKPEGKRSLGSPRRKWVDSIKMYVREIRWDGMDWFDQAETSGSIKCSKVLQWLSSLRLLKKGSVPCS
jgi:hypothetical protein